MGGVRENKVMIILRGLPGSGKSTLAGYLNSLDITGGTKVISLDQFRYVDGEYVFDNATEPRVRELFEQAVFDACDMELSPIILANTHSRHREYAKSKAMAEAHGYQVFVVEVQESFSVCCDRQSHGVPFTTMLKMVERWERGVQYALSDVVKFLEKMASHVASSINP